MPVQTHRRHDLYRLTMGPVNHYDFTNKTYTFGHNEIHYGKVFYETALCVAFVNLKPVRPGRKSFKFVVRTDNKWVYVNDQCSRVFRLF